LHYSDLFNCIPIEYSSTPEQALQPLQM